MKDIITIEHKEINENKVFFSSNCTTYANITKSVIYDPKELLKRCTKICKIIKKLDCKVSHKNKGRLFVKDNADLYEKEKLEYLHNFSMIKCYASWITSKPLHVGTSDNIELNTMYNFIHKAEKQCYRNTVFDRVNEFGNRLDEIEEMINNNDFEYSKIVF